MTLHTIANNCHPFILQIIAPVPSSGVHHLPLELMQAQNIGFLWCVKLTDRRDQEFRVHDVGVRELAILLSSHFNANLPLAFNVVPSCFLNSRIESDMFVEPILLSNTDEVGLT